MHRHIRGCLKPMFPKGDPVCGWGTRQAYLGIELSRHFDVVLSHRLSSSSDSGEKGAIAGGGGRGCLS